jgi:hypothetical protein
MPVVRILFAAIIALALGVPAGASEVRHGARAVVELFTSQGCSSCPAADALLRELGDKPEIVALAYHVDYWDYIGWPDTFGTAANSDRQRAYAQGWGSARIFTPQMIVNGKQGVVGSRRQEVEAAIDRAELVLPVTLATDGDMLKISIDGQAGLDEAVVWLVTFIDGAEVAIDKGENEGKTFAYTKIVTGRQALGMWEPGSGAQLKLPLSEVLDSRSDGIAVLVQPEEGGRPGPILGAASFLDKPRPPSGQRKLPPAGADGSE